jgi:hypothetical protein
VYGVSKNGDYQGLLMPRDPESLMDEIVVLDCQIGNVAATYGPRRVQAFMAAGG